jgi:hypothetical protein
MEEEAAAADYSSRAGPVMSEALPEEEAAAEHRTPTQEIREAARLAETGERTPLETLEERAQRTIWLRTAGMEREIAAAAAASAGGLLLEPVEIPPWVPEEAEPEYRQRVELEETRQAHMEAEEEEAAAQWEAAGELAAPSEAAAAAERELTAAMEVLAAAAEEEDLGRPEEQEEWAAAGEDRAHHL